MKIYIVRHGEVLHNALKQYNNENEDLNEKTAELKLILNNLFIFLFPLFFVIFYIL